MTPTRQLSIAPNLGANRTSSVISVQEASGPIDNSTTNTDQSESTNKNTDTETAFQHAKTNDKARRPKACTNCRRSKIKCIKEEHDQACRRCKAQGLQCLYEYKVASYKVANGSESRINQDQLTSRGIIPVENSAYLPSFSAFDANKSSGVAGKPGLYDNIPPLNRILNPVPAMKPNSHLSRNGTSMSGNEQLQSIPRLLNPIHSNGNGSQSISSHSASSSSSNSRPTSNAGLTPPSSNRISNAMISKSGLNNWENSVEERLEGFGTKLGAILSLLQNQQTQSMPNTHQQKDQRQYNDINGVGRKREIEDFDRFGANTKRQKALTNTIEESPPPLQNSQSTRQSEDLKEIMRVDPITQLKRILSKEDARELFNFFNTNISPQLFGFDISKYSIDDIWSTCPLLIATISCIASIHHSFFNHISPALEKIIYDLSKDILFNVPNTEKEAFNTIIALCFCGFWFKNDQMFTGLAIQLARTMNLISPHNSRESKSSKIPRKERLKLWYLLYILDGQQSLVFNRQSMFTSNDKLFENSRGLLEDAEKEDTQDGADKLDSAKEVTNSTIKRDNASSNPLAISTNYSDIRLVSQVEYHQAINAVFEGHAWDLLTPSSFGLPFKTNLELDKWMVQWTVLLSPFKNNPVWSSKSTLIYYNFAKLHINSSAVRKFQATGMNLPNFDEIDDDFFEATGDAVIRGKSSPNIQELHEGKKENKKRKGDNLEEDEEDEDEEDEDEDESFDMAKELSPTESRKVSAELALSAAETVLNIVLGDSDILNVLKYVPIHIHIMLYYSAILILKPHACLSGEDQHISDKFGEDTRFEASLNAIKLVKRLRHSIIVNSPTDKEFANKIVEGLTNLLRDKVRQMKRDILSGNDCGTDQQARIQTLDRVILDNDADDLHNYKLKRNQNFKISAWPGFDAGHPTKSKGAD